jgi:hypothetical protein
MTHIDTPGTAPAPTPASPAPAPAAKNGLGLAALIVGIVAMLFAIIPFLSFIAWLPALTAIGLGIAGVVKKGRKRGQALTGLILGVVAIIVGIIVSVASVAGVASNISQSIEKSIETAAPAPAAEAPAEEVAPAEEAPAAPSGAEWADTTYGTFAPVTQTGTGDSVIPLPPGATAGIVTASHDGSSNFSVQTLDAANQPTLDLLVNTIGAYAGSQAFGMQTTFGEPGATVKVSADGNWTITIAPISSALELAPTGAGDAVFLYSGGAANLTLSHDGDSNFAVSQFNDDAFNLGLLVNEIGAYQGTVPLSAGPSVITIDANGNWTATVG